MGVLFSFLSGVGLGAAALAALVLMWPEPDDE